MKYTVKKLKEDFEMAISGLDDNTVVLMQSSNNMEQGSVIKSQLPYYRVGIYKKEIKRCWDAFDNEPYTIESYRQANEESEDTIKALRIF